MTLRADMGGVELLVSACGCGALGESGDVAQIG
jgi:hypothetical protein